MERGEEYKRQEGEGLTFVVVKRSEEDDKGVNQRIDWVDNHIAIREKRNGVENVYSPSSKHKRDLSQCCTNSGVQKHVGSKQVGFKQLGSRQVGFKQLGQKQVGFKQFDPGVETRVHGVQVEKRVWFEVELQGAQGNREVEVFQVSNDDVAVAQRQLEDKQLEEKTNTDCLVNEQKNVHLGIKVGANIMVTRARGQEGAYNNVAEKKK
ncbi:hypothetical protein Tco_0739945 [Tanacetum coccineum]